jgi:hypothetical protein
MKQELIKKYGSLYESVNMSSQRLNAALNIPHFHHVNFYSSCLPKYRIYIHHRLFHRKPVTLAWNILYQLPGIGPFRMCSASSLAARAARSCICAEYTENK